MFPGCNGVGLVGWVGLVASPLRSALFFSPRQKIAETQNNYIQLLYIYSGLEWIYYKYTESH